MLKSTSASFLSVLGLSSSCDEFIIGTVGVTTELLHRSYIYHSCLQYPGDTLVRSGINEFTGSIDRELHSVDDFLPETIFRQPKLGSMIKQLLNVT